MAMTSDDDPADAGALRAIRDLEELVEALDRRVPHMERHGEVAIADDAAALKGKALARIGALKEGLRVR